jgi:hypothetical protein
VTVEPEAVLHWQWCVGLYAAEHGGTIAVLMSQQCCDGNVNDSNASNALHPTCHIGDVDTVSVSIIKHPGNLNASTMLFPVDHMRDRPSSIIGDCEVPAQVAHSTVGVCLLAKLSPSFQYARLRTGSADVHVRSVCTPGPA